MRLTKIVPQIPTTIKNQSFCKKAIPATFPTESNVRGIARAIKAVRGDCRANYPNTAPIIAGTEYAFTAAITTGGKRFNN